MKKLFSILVIITLSVYTTNCQKNETNIQKNGPDNESKVELAQIDAPDENIDKQETQGYPDAGKITNPNPPELSLPDWAVEIGITLPEGMEYIPELSAVTSVDDPKEKVNSINFTFKADYETSLKQAKIIAKKANIPIDKAFLESQKIHKKHFDEMKANDPNFQGHEIKGMIYNNHSPDPKQNNNLKYIKTIVVEENGNLVINVIDNHQLMKLSNIKH